MVRYLLVLIGCLWQPSGAYLSIRMCSRTELPWMRPQISGRPRNRGFPRLRRSESTLIRQASDSPRCCLRCDEREHEVQISPLPILFHPHCAPLFTHRVGLSCAFLTQLRSIQPAVTGYRVLRISSSCPKNLHAQIFCVGSADRFRRR